MNSDIVIKILKISLPILIILILVLISINIFKDNEKSFLKNGWISTDEPIFYHYFSKNDQGYIIKIYDRNGDFASKTEKGILKGSTLTFEGIDDSTDIYTYRGGVIYVFDINRNGIKTEFTPLERIKDE